jgi:glycosyltransferase involved in cell wall biosynthesis
MTVQPADVCLVLEGTYPYIAGGVSSWTHSLLLSQPDLRFHLVCLLPETAERALAYQLPPNVIGIEHVVVGRPPRGGRGNVRRLLENMEGPLGNVLSNGGLKDIAEILRQLNGFGRRHGAAELLNSRQAWDLLLRMYRATHAGCAFLDYFWTWRSILGGLYSILLAEIPAARVYHPLSTGYAGLFAARAHIETGRPVVLTEHGIYTNERRIEIALADWLYQAPSSGLRTDKPGRDLKDLWIDTFATYSRACYQSASRIITLYDGNQQFQIEDGADPEKLAIIPNGVDFERYSAVAARPEHPPTVALIGRVVPIKDVKTFLRAMAIVRMVIPDVEALILGPTDEDPQYFAECRALVQHLGGQDTFTFAGRVTVADYLPRLDVVALTSISEAQPLVILEAGSAGVPAVVTDVGACRDLIYGDARESEPRIPGGEVTPLANPTATAQAILRLLTNRDYWEKASRSIRERVRLYYNKPALDGAYRDLYEYWGAVEPAASLQKVTV